jgi:polyhydroxyalkanoate synthesis regulator phasin
MDLIFDNNEYNLSVSNSEDTLFDDLNTQINRDIIYDVITMDKRITEIENSISEELNQRIIQLENKIIKMEKYSEKQSKRINGIFNVVYVLLSGLYCHNTQIECHNYASSQLFEQDKECDDDVCILNIGDNPTQTHKWGKWPTTRQGDSNEKRIEILEEQINQLHQKLG